jgi:hypothetical protein
MFMRPARDLDEIDIFKETHPPQAARMKFVMHEAIGWCRQNRPALERWMESQFQAFMNAAAEGVLSMSAGQAWGGQATFLQSEQGRKYLAELAIGVDVYRRSWGGQADQMQPG